MMVCSKCKKAKEYKDFPTTTRMTEGKAKTYFHKWCKTCTSVHNTKRRAKVKAINDERKQGSGSNKKPINPYFLTRGTPSMHNKGNSITQDTNVTF